jgi:ribosomal protein S18 acetylase RimI-like enzyme
MEIHEIDLQHPLYVAELDLRYRVLRAPLGMGRDTVGFPWEGDCRHWVGLLDGAVVGCVLFHTEGDPVGAAGRLLQMAVDPGLQARGLGRSLVRRLEAEVRATGIRRVTLHARATAIGFYERLGYGAIGPTYQEVGLPHRTMERWL